MVATKTTTKPNTGRMPAKRPSYSRNYSNTNSKPRGVLSLFLSFNGKISKEVFLGMTLMLTATWSVLDTIMTYINSREFIPALEYASTPIYFLLAFALFSLGYKRSHSLGMSGFYSIVGSAFFKPYFVFFKSNRETNDYTKYTIDCSRAKKIGLYFNKSFATKILYLVLIGALVIIPYSAMKGIDVQNASAVARIIAFVISIVGFNILQLILIDTSWIKKYYMSIVKVISFLGYTAFVAGLTIVIYSTILILNMMQSAQMPL